MSSELISNSKSITDHDLSTLNAWGWVKMNLVHNNAYTNKCTIYVRMWYYDIVYSVGIGKQMYLIVLKVSILLTIYIQMSQNITLA